MTNLKRFRIRQAPSPTGYLHLGLLRQFLFSKLFSLVNQGTYYLRLEDTDRKRLLPDSALGLVKNLQTFGLEPDEGINNQNKGSEVDFYNIYQYGDLGPYIQSERLNIYHEHAQILLDRQLAYWSYLDPETRQELQDIKKATKTSINYFKINQEKFAESDLFQPVQNALQDPRKPVLTYRLQRQENIICHDLLVGETQFDLSLEEDFGILKSDGYPTYHLAHLIDDKLMQTSLVLRAQEWYPSIAKHTTMFQDYWGELPFEYLHMPFILGEVGNKKMSKRDGNVNIQNYLDRGYLPEAIINYLAFLGWNPGTEKELYLERQDFITNQDSIERVQLLIKNLSLDFSIDKLSKSPARFNQEKLNWFNRQYINMLSLEEYASRSLQHKSLGAPELSAKKYLAWNLDKNRVTTLAELGAESDCILDYRLPDKDLLKWKKISLEESLTNLQEIKDVVVRLSNDTSEVRRKLHESFLEPELNTRFLNVAKQIEESLKSWLKDNQKDTGSYLWSLRVALSGKSKSPSPFEILAIIDTSEATDRIDRCLHFLV
ncbi:MAG: glutamate--tRNA ligase [Patescibacteria group bacterium]